MKQEQTCKGGRKEESKAKQKIKIILKKPKNITKTQPKKPIVTTIYIDNL